MSQPLKFTSIDQYMATLTPEVRSILEKIRRIVKGTVPGAQETISYQMPAFRLGRVFIYFAAFKKHIGIYPPVHGDSDLAQELSVYANEKGNLRFPIDQPMPYGLIGRVAGALARQYAR